MWAYVCVRVRSAGGLHLRVSGGGGKRGREAARGASFRQKVGEFSKNIPSQHRFRKKISFSCCEGSGKRLNLRTEKHRSINDIAPDGAENRGLPAEKFAEVGGTMAEWFRASAPPDSGVERVERGGEGVLQE